MSGLKFRSTFYTVGRGLGRDPTAWHAVIASEGTDFSQDVSAVLILFDDAVRCTLLVECLRDRFALSWEVRRPGTGEHLAMVPKIDVAAMDAFVRTEHDDPVPVGSLVDRARAAEIVRSFLEDPEDLPSLVEWHPRDEITWPEP